MSDHLSIRFAPLGAAPEAVTAVSVWRRSGLAGRAPSSSTPSQARPITRAAAAADFKGRKRQTLEVLAPHKIDVQRLVVIGLGAAPAN